MDDGTSLRNLLRCPFQSVVRYFGRHDCTKKSLNWMCCDFFPKSFMETELAEYFIYYLCGESFSRLVKLGCKFVIKFILMHLIIVRVTYPERVLCIYGACDILLQNHGMDSL